MQHFSPRYYENPEGPEEDTTRLLAERLDCLSVQSDPIRVAAAHPVTPAPSAVPVNPPLSLAAQQAALAQQQAAQGQQQQVAQVQQQHVAVPPVDKRDSLSDSGAEGSGTNTPTRGRTVTDGLLRFVQDNSLAKPIPERKIRQADTCCNQMFTTFWNLPGGGADCRYF